MELIFNIGTGIQGSSSSVIGQHSGNSRLSYEVVASHRHAHILHLRYLVKCHHFLKTLVAKACGYFEDTDILLPRRKPRGPRETKYTQC